MNDVGMKILETERLVLRKFKLEDAEGMYNNWATDPLCNRYISWDLHKSIEDTKAIITMWINEYDEGRYNWIVELKDTHEVIGSITAVHIHKNDLNVEIGYCYGSKYWGKGYATEALKRVIDFFLNECDMHLVEACHISGNPASGRVMEKAGMRKDAVLRDRRNNKDTKKRYKLLLNKVKDNFVKYGSKKYSLLDVNGQYFSKVPGTLGGNKKLKIYGKLDCPSALRYLEKGCYKENRVFFENIEVAQKLGYRPCAKCMRKEYEKWKDEK